MSSTSTGTPNEGEDGLKVSARDPGLAVWTGAGFTPSSEIACLFFE
ncbi:hypothetical protein CGMCC3_g2953 [Colletotrichum fructicola]|nr:uncharacterized protein CGMCC3_g2953 [Colletotrichum fructicola]KAE9580999.1 hypothetical protein CGMCC3_g2953 [Colletotrichum fructicola]